MRIRYYIDGTVDGWRAYWGVSRTTGEVAKLSSRILEFVTAYVALRWPHADLVSRIVPGRWKGSVEGALPPYAVLAELDFVVGEAYDVGALAVPDEEWDSLHAAWDHMERGDQVKVARRTDAVGLAAALRLLDEAAWGDIDSAQDCLVEILDVLATHGVLTKEHLLPFLTHWDWEVREAAIQSCRECDDAPSHTEHLPSGEINDASEVVADLRSGLGT